MEVAIISWGGIRMLQYRLACPHPLSSAFGCVCGEKGDYQRKKLYWRDRKKKQMCEEYGAIARKGLELN